MCHPLVTEGEVVTQLCHGNFWMIDERFPWILIPEKQTGYRQGMRTEKLKGVDRFFEGAYITD